MTKADDVIREVGALVKEGARLLELGQKDDVSLGTLALAYETWYTKALATVTQIIPERRAEFVEAYRREKRRDISAESYTISDCLAGLSVTQAGRATFSTKASFAARILRQVAIVNAAGEALPSVLPGHRGVLQAELLDSDIDTARELARGGHLRAAGTVVGVVLEAHFGAIVKRRSLKIPKKTPTIADFNDFLKDQRVYDLPMWRLIQRLGDIRNLCAHSKEREPTRDEVMGLLSGTEKVIKEVF